jgi:hypothetical protein
MRRTHIGTAIVLGVVVAGCTLPEVAAVRSTAARHAPKESAPSLVGQWKGKLEVGATPKDDPGAQFAAGLAAAMGEMMNARLEFPTEDRFILSVMTMPFEGKVQRDGNKLTLVPETIMGLSREEAKQLGATKNELSDLRGTISDDGSEIRLESTGKEGGAMVFRRDREAAASTERPVASKIRSSAEERLVGDWSVQIEAPRSGKGGLSEQEAKVLAAMESSMKLRLSQDLTFSLNMMVEILGKWELDGDRITLYPTKMMGMDIKESEGTKADPLVGVVSSDGRTITASEPGGSGRVVFTKR